MNKDQKEMRKVPWERIFQPEATGSAKALR